MTDYALKRKMRDLHITMRSKYSRISQTELNKIVKDIWKENNELGIHIYKRDFIYDIAFLVQI